MMFGGHCKGRHAAALTAPTPAFSPPLSPSPPPPPPPPLRTHIHVLTSHAPSALRSGATTMCTCSLSRRTSGPSRSAPARCRSRARAPVSLDAGPPSRAQEQPGFRLAPPSQPPPPSPPGAPPALALGRDARPRCRAAAAAPLPAPPTRPPPLPPRRPPPRRALFSLQPPHGLYHRGGGRGRALAAQPQGVHPGRLRRAGHLARLLHGRALPRARHLDLGEGACQYRTACRAHLTPTRP